MLSTQLDSFGHQYHCTNQQRRNAIQNQRDEDGLPRWNGIDYVELDTNQQTLWVYFIHPLQQNLQEALIPEQIRIEGSGAPVEIEELSVWSDRLTLTLNHSGDATPYTLRLVQFPLNDADPQAPPMGFDRQLSQIRFGFRLGQVSEFDPATVTTAAIADLPPVIDYLAKDYASFRQLMLDRLAVTMPQWKERSPADVGNMLVELVAYTADHLSYFQDAVATEAYLGTARRRTSVRRHARSLNYPMHDGCNARVWIVLTVNQAVTLPPFALGQPSLHFLSQIQGLPPTLSEQNYRTAIAAGAEVFELLSGVSLHPVCNQIRFYTWGEINYTLPIGTTSATLDDRHGQLADRLQPGMVLLLQEVKGTSSGFAADANPARRHFVRLTQTVKTEDELFNLQLLEITWHLEDQLPFPLVIATVIDDRPVTDLSLARGNVVLADHGRTVAAADRQNLGVVPPGDRFHPQLPEPFLTFQGQVRNAEGQFVTVDPTRSATQSLVWEIQNVKPAIVVREHQQPQENQPLVEWRPQKDLLNSSRFAREFVVEPEVDGRVYLRFGDGELGRRPTPATQLLAFYRVGNGTAGNVGADAIAHLFIADPALADFLAPATADLLKPLYNPLAAAGGIDPEPLEQIRLYAPQAFKTRQRAVTEADYAEIAQQFPGVAKAIATRRWTGSWYTFFITVDRQGGGSVTQDLEFKPKLRAYLDRFRLTGHDIEIEDPRFVPLEIAMKVQVLPDYFRSQVQEALLKTFSSQVLDNGQLGFFHPDNFTFNQSLYLSQVIVVAMRIAGVQSVVMTQFQRSGANTNDDLEQGRISLGRLEIARLDNHLGTAKTGRITFVMEGGL
jgi:Baseplate J-like protein